MQFKYEVWLSLLQNSYLSRLVSAHPKRIWSASCVFTPPKCCCDVGAVEWMNIVHCPFTCIGWIFLQLLVVPVRLLSVLKKIKDFCSSFRPKRGFLLTQAQCRWENYLLDRKTKKRLICEGSKFKSIWILPYFPHTNGLASEEILWIFIKNSLVYHN